MTIGNKDFQQAVNRTLILRMILLKKEISRAGLARELGMYRSTVSNIVDSLINENWLVESGMDDSSPGAGRRGQNLEINRTKGLVIGIFLRQNGTYQLTAVNSVGDIKFSETGYCNSKNFDQRIAYLIEILKKLEISQGLPLLGAGLSLSGIIDTDRQIVINSLKHKLKEKNFIDQYTGSCDFPFLIENDSRCCTWGKAWVSHGQKDDTFVYLFLNRQEGGDSLGMGIYMDGHIRYGAHKLSGTFPPSFIERAKKKAAGALPGLLKNPLDLKGQFNGVFSEIADEFLDMISILDPNKVYLGHEFEAYREGVEEYITQKEGLLRFDVEFAGMGVEETSFGAASFMLNRLYALPEVGQ